MPEKILVIAYRARARGNTFLQLKVEDATVATDGGDGGVSFLDRRVGPEMP